MSRADFTLSYQKSPIILTGGIATNVPGTKLPIISLTESIFFENGILSGASALDLERFLFDFQPLPGGTLIDQQLATFPFANQTIAANAAINQPLSISLLMLAPVNRLGGYPQKISVFQALQKSLNLHNQQGGLYTVVTPSYMYEDCFMLSLRDVSPGDPARTQDHWQWDFRQPLVTIAAAQQAQNSLMLQATSGAKITPGANGQISFSGIQPSLGNPASGVTPSVVPASRNLAGASVGSSGGNRTSAN